MKFFRTNQELGLTRIKTNYLTSGVDLLPSFVNTYNFPFKILGFWFDLNGPNYTLIVSDLKQYVDNIVSQKHFKLMSMRGRAKVTNTLIYAKLNYYTKIITLLQTDITYFKRKIDQFMWNSEKEFISREVLFQPTDCGGIDLPDLNLYCSTYRIQFIIKLLQTDMIAINFSRYFLHRIAHRLNLPCIGPKAFSPPYYYKEDIKETVSHCFF